MILRFILGLVALLSLCLAPLPVHASLLNFYFTTVTSGGTITGEIEGLQNTGVASTPSDIVIFSQPSGFTYGPSGSPYSLLGHGFTFYGSDDTFTVNTAGTVVAADVTLYQTFSGNYQGYGFDASEDGYVGANGVYQDVGGVTTAALNTGGFAGTVYTPVPEPRAEALVVLLAAAVLIFARKLQSRFSQPAFAA
jgi:hypothetical protein